jgi:hypothetical protein
MIFGGSDNKKHNCSWIDSEVQLLGTQDSPIQETETQEQIINYSQVLEFYT